ncbi:MAG: 3-deoxy-D-manno-octulosonic acid transferase, partial [Pseudomonadales bacterium]|nr:3-deoxy-D-manno-octulosonic acid transferase [Pseudomonadales bacterium]
SAHIAVDIKPSAVDINTDIVIGDTMGELLMFYGAADVAFVGGSLMPVGGHNLIEPAAWACPVISGPHIFNFSEIERLLLKNDALATVHDADTLATAIDNCLSNDLQRRESGERAKAVADNNRGALQRLCALVEELIL